MKTLFVMICVMLGGCATQGEANLMKGELFANEHHRININPKKLYTFRVKFGHMSSTVSPQED